MAHVQRNGNKIMEDEKQEELEGYKTTAWRLNDRNFLLSYTTKTSQITPFDHVPARVRGLKQLGQGLDWPRIAILGRRVADKIRLCQLGVSLQAEMDISSAKG